MSGVESTAALTDPAQILARVAEVADLTALEDVVRTVTTERFIGAMAGRPPARPAYTIGAAS